METTTKTQSQTIPTLVFDAKEPELPVAAEVSGEALVPAEEPKLDETILTPEEQKAVDNFCDKIDIHNSNAILQYGVGAQKKLASFSESTLENVQTKDLDEIGNMLSEVVVELKGFDVEEEEKGFLGLFKKSSNKLAALKTKYAKAETNINQIAGALEKHQVQLLKDVAILDKMYELNLSYFKELSMYILAGKKKLEQVRGTELVALTDKAKASNLPEDAQAVRDLQSQCERFEKKIHDLELTRMVSIQMAPQIRMIQGSDSLMVEKIQSTLVNTIPLWKNQMVLALGASHAGQAAKAQREVTDMTNELLKKNAAILKDTTIEAAKESERGIVDLETLKNTNASLISTLDEVMKIQTEGRQKRQAAEAEMLQMENQLKDKLLEISK